MDGPAAEIRYPWETPPAPGEGVEVAPGILWLRLSLPMALDHVNVYALDDGERGWTVFDAGLDTRRSRSDWESLLDGPLAGRPVWRLIVSHYHPDHIGLAAWLMERTGAELWTTRLSWTIARMLVLDRTETHPPETLAFWRAAGLDDDTIARRQSEKPFNFSDIVGLPPAGFHRIREGDTLTAGGRRWLLRTGDGHAPEQVTLWSQDDNLVIGADQLLPSISPNLSVYPSEPGADPVREWLDSCRRFTAHATPAQLVLPGHKLPFTGLPFRLRQKIDNHLGALNRLEDHLATPRVAADCFAPLFKREITAQVYGMALGETVAHLNHLLHAGRATRTLRDDGAWLWSARKPA